MPRRIISVHSKCWRCDPVSCVNAAWVLRNRRQNWMISEGTHTSVTCTNKGNTASALVYLNRWIWTEPVVTSCVNKKTLEFLLLWMIRFEPITRYVCVNPATGLWSRWTSPLTMTETCWNYIYTQKHTAQPLCAWPQCSYQCVFRSQGYLFIIFTFLFI